MMHKVVAKESTVIFYGIYKGSRPRQRSLRTLQRTNSSLASASDSPPASFELRSSSPQPPIVPFSPEKRTELHPFPGTYACTSRGVLRNCHGLTLSGSSYLLPSVLLLRQQQSRAIRVRSFHSTPRNQGLYPIVILLAFLKNSAALGGIKMVARVSLSLLPVFLIKKFKIVRWLRRNLRRQDIDEIFMVKWDDAIRRIRILNKILLAMFLIPLVLLILTIIASAEKTPITGRYRFILLSPEEEEVIHSQLTGAGWRAQVCDVLTSQSPDGKTPPTIIPSTDWRWKWVVKTLRQLEAGIYDIYQSNKDLNSSTTTETGDTPIPPPLLHPLNPRPRASTLLHAIPQTDDSNRPHSTENPHTHHLPPHTQLGPPYSLMIVENPERNAFSYGFGAEGAGGVVLYSGFLDEVLQQPNSNDPAKPSSGGTSFLSSLFGRSSSSHSTSSLSNTEPTPEQTARLATLLSHELAHLLLSHHLETLSSGTILVPTVTSIILDFARVIVFPITFLFGPFVGDALADFGKVGMGEVRKLSETCNNHMLELEADTVSVRLMSFAGFDPRKAVEFWESKLEDSRALDANSGIGMSSISGENSSESFWSPHHSLLGTGPTSHPVGSERVRKLRAELQRWKDEAKRRSETRQDAGKEI